MKRFFKRIFNSTFFPFSIMFTMAGAFGGGIGATGNTLSGIVLGALLAGTISFAILILTLD